MRNFPPLLCDSKGEAMYAEKIGKHFRSLFPNGQVVQLVDPAENTDGLYVRYANAAAGNGYVNLYASPTAPSGPGDINTRIIFCGNNSGRAGEQAQVFLSYPLFIPAGHGIWASSGSFQAGAAPTGGLGLSWDFLG